MRSWIIERFRAWFLAEEARSAFFRHRSGILVVVEAGKVIPKRRFMWHPLLLKKVYQKKRRRYGCHIQRMILS
jgi:hypothetical protein